MNCFCFKNAKNHHAKNCHHDSSHQTMSSTTEQLVLQIQGCIVHLITPEGDTTEIAKGAFKLIKLVEDNVCLATVIKVGEDLHWPLTKDEPVVKLDGVQYLFTLPLGDGQLLNYGVTFGEVFGGELGLLDSFLKENSCFSYAVASSGSGARGVVVNWKEFAPKIENYNGVLAKAIAGGTGEIVKGIFKCSNGYSKQVHKGGDMIINQVIEEKNITSDAGIKSNKGPNKTNKTGVNKGLKRVRKLSQMTEKMSKSLLNGVGIASGTIVAPMVRSEAGKKFLAMVPGEILLASLDAVNKVLDAVEAAEKQALSATSKTATRVVTNRFGESAGEVTEDIFATAGHCAGTAWNIFKIRKAINPASSLPSAIVKNAVKQNIR